jgi:thiamine pyrophosphate-dependent acetolactate synthase large subunit-like protein
VTVSTERDLAAALSEADGRDGPTVIDVQVDPAAYPAIMDLSRGEAGRAAAISSNHKEHPVSITVAKFKDVAEGTQPGQFTIGERAAVSSLAELDPSFKRLLDEPVTAVVAVMGRDEHPNLTPVWFDYALRDPSIDERRVLFEMAVVKVATFGRP